MFISLISQISERCQKQPPICQIEKKTNVKKQSCGASFYINQFMIRGLGLAHYTGNLYITKPQVNLNNYTSYKQDQGHAQPLVYIVPVATNKAAPIRPNDTEEAQDNKQDIG